MFILENNKLQASGISFQIFQTDKIDPSKFTGSSYSFGKELEALQLYLELESLRFEQKFEYKISIAGRC